MIEQAATRQRPNDPQPWNQEVTISESAAQYSPTKSGSHGEHANPSEVVAMETSPTAAQADEPTMNQASATIPRDLFRSVVLTPGATATHPVSAPPKAPAVGLAVAPADFLRVRKRRDDEQRERARLARARIQDPHKLLADWLIHNFSEETLREVAKEFADGELPANSANLERHGE